MKSKLLVGLVLLVLISGCSEGDPGSKAEVSEAKKEAFEKAQDKIATDSILSEFMDRISNDDFEKAIGLLHPQLKDAWTIATFTQDWEIIRDQLSKEWGPEASSTFAGKSNKGPYEKATYRLSSDWRSLSTIELLSMQDDGKEYIVQVHLRVPYKDKPPGFIVENTDQLATMFINEKYDDVENFMTPNCKKNFPSGVLKQIHPVLGNDESKIEKNLYRLLVNSVWYDAIRLNQSDNSVTFIEFILSSNNGQSKIETITLRGKMN